MAHGASVAVFIAQLVVLLSCGRLAGELMQRVGQPAVTGQIIAGVLLGPSVLGALAPQWWHGLFPAVAQQQAMLDAIAQLGILLLLLITGMETDLSVFRDARRPAVAVSVSGIIVPFLCGCLLGALLPGAMLPQPQRRLITTLFLGTALSVSSVKIVALVVRELGFLRRTVGQVIVAAAILDDTIGWIVLSVIFGLALRGALDFAAVAHSVLGVALFLALSLTFGRRLVFRILRWSNDTLESEMANITTILVIMGLLALLTNALGVHFVLGAFVAGLLLGQSPMLTRQLGAQLRGLIVGLFMPVFFTLVGLTIDVSALGQPQFLWLTLGLIALASVGKFLGAFIGGRFGGLSPAESFAVGCGMNARGSTEIIVASLALAIGAFSGSLFTMVVAMAVVTTMAMPPMLRWALARLPLTPEEQARLEREGFEARGFVTNVERLLVAVDESENGRFASRLAGLLAGSRRIPSTVLPFGSAGSSKPSGGSGADVEAIVKGAAGAAQIESARAYDAQAGIDVITRARGEKAEQAVAEQARKGHDFLLIGFKPTIDPDGGIDENVASTASVFEGPFALAVARGQHQAEPAADTPLDILVPLTGTRHSQRGFEVALTLARAGLGSVTALYVVRPQHRSRRPGLHRLRAAWNGLSDNAEAVLRNAVRLGDQFGVAVRTAARTQVVAETAILSQLSTVDHNLVVMGVTPRSGASLFLGNTATAMLARSERSLLLVAS